MCDSFNFNLFDSFFFFVKLFKTTICNLWLATFQYQLKCFLKKFSVVSQPDIVLIFNESPERFYYLSIDEFIDTNQTFNSQILINHYLFTSFTIHTTPNPLVLCHQMISWINCSRVRHSKVQSRLKMGTAISMINNDRIKQLSVFHKRCKLITIQRISILLVHNVQLMIEMKNKYVAS